LRSETHELHDQLERLVAVDRQIASPAHYAAYLLRLWACHVAAEAQLLEVDFTPLGFDYRNSIRSRLIEADLEHLGITSARRAAQSRPDRLQLPTIEAALGYVYVIEGSAIGARAILPEITAALGFDAQRGASFFGGLREGKQVWQGCLAALDAIECNSRGADVVVQSSKEAFRLFLRWLPSPEQTTFSSVQLS
jgi:heme oxygenase (biliverdin-IX-beta and delta-forming)